MGGPDQSLIETLFSGALTLAGILLVFVGFIYSRVQAFPSTTDNTVMRRYTVVAKLGTLPFVMALLLTGLTFQDLAAHGTSLWPITRTVFWIEMVMLFLYGTVSILYYLN